MNSANFAFWAFSEVCLSGSLRGTHPIDSLRVFSESAAIVCLFGARRLSQQSLLPFPSPEKVAARVTRRIPQMNDFCRY